MGNISKKIQDIKLVEGKDLHPYIAWLACKRGIIPKVEVENRAVKNVKLSVFSRWRPDYVRPLRSIGDAMLSRHCDGT